VTVSTNATSRSNTPLSHQGGTFRKSGGVSRKRKRAGKHSKGKPLPKGKYTYM
jgi:hypothetical protein